MKLGYFTLTDNPSAYAERRQDADQLLLDTIEQALATERLGFNSVWLPEHHFGGFGVMPTPSQCLAYVAARTERVKLVIGSGRPGSAPPFRAPSSTSGSPSSSARRWSAASASTAAPSPARRCARRRCISPATGTATCTARRTPSSRTSPSPTCCSGPATS